MHFCKSDANPMQIRCKSDAKPTQTDVKISANFPFLLSKYCFLLSRYVIIIKKFEKEETPYYSLGVALVIIASAFLLHKNLKRFIINLKYYERGNLVINHPFSVFFSF